MVDVSGHAPSTQRGARVSLRFQISALARRSKNLWSSLLSHRFAQGSDPLDEPHSVSGTLTSNARDQSPERSDGTAGDCTVSETSFDVPSNALVVTR
jgi:hypothetical protein